MLHRFLIPCTRLRSSSLLSSLWIYHQYTGYCEASARLLVISATISIITAPIITSGMYCVVVIRLCKSIRMIFGESYQPPGVGNSAPSEGCNQGCGCTRRMKGACQHHPHDSKRHGGGPGCSLKGLTRPILFNAERRRKVRRSRRPDTHIIT